MSGSNFAFVAPGQAYAHMPPADWTDRVARQRPMQPGDEQMERSPVTPGLPLGPIVSGGLPSNRDRDI